MSERGQFATRLGAIAATVGSAVGLGNIWRFPCEAGEHGGGAFMLIYLICVAIMGIPVIVAEFVIGRGTHRNVRAALQQLAPTKKLHWVSWLSIIASIMILSFYSVVCGWILEYLYQSLTGAFQGLTAEEFHSQFGSFVANPWRSCLWTVLFLLVNFLVLTRGVKKGIERVANVMMPLLFIILIIFAINSLMLPKAREGLTFLFSPDFSKINSKVVIGAMGQAFFSLSLGLSCLLTYASYFKDSDRLVRNATIIALLDTAVAVLAGIMIFPAIFSFNMSAQGGPTLVFEVLPAIFQQMPAGYLWSILFFILLFFASLTSTISMSEISITFFSEEYKMSRKRATALNTGIAMVLGVLCALSFGVLSGFTIAGMTVFELFDYISSNILLPVGGIFFAFFVGWIVDKKFLYNQLTNNGTVTPRVHGALRFCIRYVAPAAIAVVFIYGFLS